MNLSGLIAQLLLSDKVMCVELWGLLGDWQKKESDFCGVTYVLLFHAKRTHHRWASGIDKACFECFFFPLNIPHSLHLSYILCFCISDPLTVYLFLSLSLNCQGQGKCVYVCVRGTKNGWDGTKKSERDWTGEWRVNLMFFHLTSQFAHILVFSTGSMSWAKKSCSLHVSFCESFLLFTCPSLLRYYIIL